MASFSCPTISILISLGEHHRLRQEIRLIMLCIWGIEAGGEWVISQKLYSRIGYNKLFVTHMM